MFRKTAIAILLGIVSCTSLAWAAGPNDYLVPGRAALFDGTLSGVRQAYQIFDDGLNNYPTDRKLKFFHAVAGTAMLIIKDDGGSVDSVFELAKQFGIEVLGDYWAPYYDPCELDVNVPLDEHDAYEIPPGAPDANEIRNIIDSNMIPQIEDFIADLNSIGDAPGDRFRIFLDPCETRIFFDPYALGLQTDVEVDYGEVLLLKGLLVGLKSHLQAQAAYDLYTDPNDKLAEQIYGECFSINEDLLDPYPEFLTVLPSSHNANNGAANLAQARQDWVDSVNYYLNAIDYIRHEERQDYPPTLDPQDDELIYIDPNDELLVDTANEKLITLRDSLANDTIITYPVETTKTYDINDVSGVPIGQLVLVYDFTTIEGDEGSLTFTDGVTPSPWEVEWVGREDTNLISVDVEHYDGGWWGGYFEGTLSQDGNSITNATFAYWGTTSDTLSGLSGQLVSTEVVDANLDLNPIFASSPDVNSPRYAQPVNPRDLLPKFDEWNGPQPGTMGHGLGDDATLGGITPDMNQYDWQVLCDLQPGGLFYLQEIYPWQKDEYGYADIWLEHQLIFEDLMSDTWGDVNNVDNVDIDRLYIGYDDDYLYGAIILHDYNSIDSSGQAYYDLYLSYTPDDKSSLYSIKLEVHLNYGVLWGEIYYMDDSYGYPNWEYKSAFDARMGQNGIEFRMLWTSIPSYLPGRFISLNTEGCDDTCYNWNGEDNETHLQLGRLGTISGTVSYNGYKGTPIFVQACTDPEEPEDSIVATTMILEPGPYTLQGVGLGWEGYVRAFTPLFGLNVFDLEALNIQDSVPVFLWLENLDGVDLVLNNPALLRKDVWLPGEIDANSYEQDWYAFDAVQDGNYALDVNRLTSPYASMTLYGRDGHTELEELYYWQTQHIDWICPISGRYYVKVADGYWSPEGGTYQIRMTSDLTCPQADIACAQWVGVKDCRVDFYDLAVLVSNWLNSCSQPYWCDDSDFDKSGFIDFADFAVLANEWLQDAAP